MSTRHKLAQALRLIKDHVCGNRVPRWSTDEHVFASREAIANLCDEALAAHEAQAQAVPPPMPKPARVEAVQFCDDGLYYSHAQLEERDAQWAALLAEREGLTDEQINEFHDSVIGSPYFGKMQRFARAIEQALAEKWGVKLRAHGIK